MAKQITINAVTGVSPYDVYICDISGINCFYIATTSVIPYTFEIPVPFDQLTNYQLKLVDAQKCIITSTS